MSGVNLSGFICPIKHVGYKNGIFVPCVPIPGLVIINLSGTISVP